MTDDAKAYLQWLRSTDLDQALYTELVQAVQVVIAALEDMPEESLSDEEFAVLESLTEAHRQLDAGGLPKEQLLAFRTLFDGGLALPKPAVELLEEELREIAAGIAKERWTSETYSRFESAVDAFHEGGEESDLWEVVEDIERLLVSVTEHYQNTDILAHEVTAESLVVHRLLTEALQSWGSALALIQGEEEPDWDEILAFAEQGNRLMVAVQIFQGRLKNALS